MENQISVPAVREVSVEVRSAEDGRLGDNELGFRLLLETEGWDNVHLFASLLLASAYLFTLVGLVLKHSGGGIAAAYFFFGGILTWFLCFVILFKQINKTEIWGTKDVNNFLGSLSIYFVPFALIAAFLYFS